MSKLINISETFCRTEAYDAAVLNCYAFRRGTDERNGIVLSLGNVMGKILMACRRALVNGTEPNIDYALLRNSRINILGTELSFNQHVKAA